MVSGFLKAERTMKCLFVRKLHLWPRFQVYVSQELEKDPPEVIDVRVPMSSSMKVIQKAIIEVMDACLKEMRKTNKVDVEDLTVENGLFKSFDEIVRRQLDPIWHTLGKTTKQLVSDLKTLRKLLDYLVRYDAVTYLKYLDSLRASESFRSVWIFVESSYKIFEYAKKRVYIFARSDTGKSGGQGGISKKRKLMDSNDKKEGSLSSSATGGVHLEEVLEEPPKWKVLREILEEIEEERQKQALSTDGLMTGSEEENNGIILVACKDEHSCMQLEECIINGPKKIMREEWEKYLLSKVELKGLQHTKSAKKKPKEPKGFGILDGIIPVRPKENTDTGSINKHEHDALVAAASEVLKLAKKNAANEDPPQLLAGDQLGKGKEKVKGNTSLKRAQNLVNDNQRHLNGAAKNKKSEVSGSDNGYRRSDNDSVVIGGFDENSNGVLKKHTGDIDTPLKGNTKPLPPVHFHALESDPHILDILKPSIIIAYHPDVTFVREIEVYNAENPSKKLKVYFLFYEDSTEVQKFEASIRRENGAFESLIRQKSLMMIPVDPLESFDFLLKILASAAWPDIWDEHLLGLSSSEEPRDPLAQNSITRKAGGRKVAEKEMQVIVDMREFMSSLPNVLHQKGMRIIPVTLEVGDYILSPQICVERKSIQDLFMSFTSGRLYHQVETMVRFYRIPVLLIEFSQDKSFSFQSASDIGDDVTPNSIISKLTLLVMHFPRLRIVWSRSLHATAEIFASLKANQDEPDEVKAIRVGVPSEEGLVENDVRAENYNTSAVELLRRLPGVTDSNYRAIIDGCDSLSELALLPVERLAELMGGLKAARTLREFLDAKYPTLL
ncbi:DNA repair endonuclease uvh1 [Ancistrocladus abbreviatus]